MLAQLLKPKSRKNIRSWVGPAFSDLMLCFGIISCSNAACTAVWMSLSYLSTSPPSPSSTPRWLIGQNHCTSSVIQNHGTKAWKLCWHRVAACFLDFLFKSCATTALTTLSLILTPELRSRHHYTSLAGVPKSIFKAMSKGVEAKQKQKVKLC